MTCTYFRVFIESAASNCRLYMVGTQGTFYIKTAFLNEFSDREINVMTRNDLPDSMKRNILYLLLKEFYGLHQVSLIFTV